MPVRPRDRRRPAPLGTPEIVPLGSQIACRALARESEHFRPRPDCPGKYARLAGRQAFSLAVEIDSEQHERPKHDGEDRREDRLWLRSGARSSDCLLYTSDAADEEDSVDL